MNKILRLLLIPILMLLMAVLSSIAIFHYCKIDVSTVVNILLSKIPIVNQFIDITTNSGVYSLKQLDKKELRTATWNVDFLVSIGADRKYIALYPYIVEAGVDLSDMNVVTRDTTTIIELPNAKIMVSDLDETKDILIIRKGEANLNYNLHLKPLKIAFEKRARDLAIEAGILKDANDKAEEYLQKLLSNSYKKLIVKKENAPYPELSHYSASMLPIEFVYDSNSLQRKFDFNDLGFSRDNILIPTYKTRLGYSRSVNYSLEEMDTIGWFNKTLARYSNQDKPTLVMKYVDPIKPTEKRVYFDVNSLYRNGYIWMDGNLYYFNSLKESDEVQSQSLAANILYLAMSAKKDHRTLDADYKQWIEYYNKIIRTDGLNDYLAKKDFGSIRHCLDSMACIKNRNSLPLSDEELILNSLVELEINNNLKLEGKDAEVDLLLRFIYLLNNRHYDVMNDNYQREFLGYATFNDDEKREYKQFFYPLDVTSASVRNEYKNDLIKFSPKYDYEIAHVLNEKHFLEYMYVILRNYDNNGHSYNNNKGEYIIDDQTHSLFRTVGHKEDLQNEEFDGALGIKNIVRGKGLYKDTCAQLALVYVSKPHQKQVKSDDNSVQKGAKRANNFLGGNHIEDHNVL